MSDLRITELTIDADLSLPSDLTEASVISLALHVLQEEGAEGEWTLGFRFVDDAEMQRMHLAYMGLDSPTDIMTFPLDDDWSFDDAAGVEGGVEADQELAAGGFEHRAADQAGDDGWDTARELHFLVVHGLLHLLEWDDLQEGARDVMLARQRELLASWPDAAW